jgi:putative tryptophan/tyrosine transport system substrate-binding protein
MKRRQFLTVLGGAAAWPLAARAQQPGKLRTIGFLGVASASVWGQWVAAFVQRLRELGWIEGRTVAIEYRWADGHTERFAEIAAEFARLKVDIIVTAGPQAVSAAKQAMPVTPIVFAITGDAVGTGIVASLARPGGNVTGLSMLIPDTAGKKLELLREVVPGLRRLAVLANVGFSESLQEMGVVQPMARTLGLDVATLEIRRAEDIAPAFEALNGGAQALYVCSDPLVNTNRDRINTLAQSARSCLFAAVHESGNGRFCCKRVRDRARDCIRASRALPTVVPDRGEEAAGPPDQHGRKDPGPRGPAGNALRRHGHHTIRDLSKL